MDDEMMEGGGQGVNDMSMSNSMMPGIEESESMMMQPTSGKNRFDTLIKSLIARIEFNNTLAPIQEYGRHQKKAANNKKK